MDWIAGVLSVIRTVLCIEKSKWTWVLRMVAIVCYGIIGVQDHRYGSMFFSVVLLILSVIGFIKWSKKDETN